MSEQNIWPGSASFSAGDTPFGIYDYDMDFMQDAPRVASWCAIRLGYPIQNVELIDKNFYACFEEAVSEYSSQVNQWNIRNNLDILRGRNNRENFTGKEVQGTSIQNVVKMSDSYGTLVGVGGKTDIKKGYVDLVPGQQDYDLKEWADNHEDGKEIIISKVFYEGTPAINRFFDPYSVSGQGTLNLIDEFGFGSFSPAAQFVLMPIYEDLLRIQAIEFNDQIRKSAHTFNIVNNKLKIFPIPSATSRMGRLWFEYYVEEDYRQDATYVSENDRVVADYANIRYDFISYDRINDVGKQWIRKYTLALSKELLGAIREKYDSIPIPVSEVSLDGAALRSEAQSEKEELIEKLRENLEDVSRRSQNELRAEESQHMQDVLRTVPNYIYIG